MLPQTSFNARFREARVKGGVLSSGLSSRNCCLLVVVFLGVLYLGSTVSMGSMMWNGSSSRPHASSADPGAGDHATISDVGVDSGEDWKDRKKGDWSREEYRAEDVQDPKVDNLPPTADRRPRRMEGSGAEFGGDAMENIDSAAFREGDLGEKGEAASVGALSTASEEGRRSPAPIQDERDESAAGVGSVGTASAASAVAPAAIVGPALPQPHELADAIAEYHEEAAAAAVVDDGDGGGAQRVDEIQVDNTLPKSPLNGGGESVAAAPEDADSRRGDLESVQESSSISQPPASAYASEHGGDYHLPLPVTWAFRPEERGGDSVANPGSGSGAPPDVSEGKQMETSSSSPYAQRTWPPSASLQAHRKLALYDRDGGVNSLPLTDEELAVRYRGLLLREEEAALASAGAPPSLSSDRHLPVSPFPNLAADAAGMEAVREAFLHSWNAYKRHAWGADTLKPISRSSDNGFLHMGISITDSLTTLAVMNLTDEIAGAVDWLASSLLFTTQEDVNVFETTIRVVGGLVSGWELTHRAYPALLAKARECADALAVAFDSATGLPFGTVGLASHRRHNPSWIAGSTISEVSSLQLEYEYLSHATGDARYAQRTRAVMAHLQTVEPPSDSLYPMFINPDSGSWAGSKVITLGARGDSLYEYLLKQYLLAGGLRLAVLERMQRGDQGEERVDGGDGGGEDNQRGLGDLQTRRAIRGGGGGGGGAGGVLSKKIMGGGLLPPAAAAAASRKAALFAGGGASSRKGGAGSSVLQAIYGLRGNTAMESQGENSVFHFVKGPTKESWKKARDMTLAEVVDSRGRSSGSGPGGPSYAPLFACSDESLAPSCSAALVKNGAVTANACSAHLQRFLGTTEPSHCYAAAAAAATSCRSFPWHLGITPSQAAPPPQEASPPPICTSEQDSAPFREAAWFTSIAGMFWRSAAGIEKELLRYSKPSSFAYLTERMGDKGASYEDKMDHLVCFWPGVLALGSLVAPTDALARRHLSLARELLDTCINMYDQTESGLAAEITRFPGGQDPTPDPHAKHNLLRPETAESLMILYRVTGDEAYRQAGRRMLAAFNQHSRIDTGGYTTLRDVTSAHPEKNDHQESFWLAETCKYLYLLFAPSSLIPLDKYVFNTEAHPLPVF